MSAWVVEAERSGTDSLLPGVKAVVVVAVHVLRPTERCHRPASRRTQAVSECKVCSIRVRSENSNSESNRAGIGPEERAGGQAVVHTSVLVSSSAKKERSLCLKKVGPNSFEPGFDD